MIIAIIGLLVGFVVGYVIGSKKKTQKQIGGNNSVQVQYRGDTL